MEDLELVELAIDDYSLFNKTQKNVLKALIRVDFDGCSIISIKDLCKAVSASSTPVSNALSFLEKEKVIEDIKHRGVVFTGCVINKEKITDIISRYKTKKLLLEKN